MSVTDYSAAYLKATIRAGKGSTGIFGLRLMRKNLDDLTTLFDQVFPGLPSDKARLEAAFGKILYIHLAREGNPHRSTHSGATSLMNNESGSPATFVEASKSQSRVLPVLGVPQIM